jgi:hypothetical protein
MTMPNIFNAKARIERALAWLERYNDAMADKEIPPNGDDYNEIASAVEHILCGGEDPEINITEKGR